MQRLELRQGWTIAEIAGELSHHPGAIPKWPKSAGPPPAREMNPSERAIDEHVPAAVADRHQARPRCPTG